MTIAAPTDQKFPMTFSTFEVVEVARSPRAATCWAPKICVPSREVRRHSHPPPTSNANAFEMNDSEPVSVVTIQFRTKAIPALVRTKKPDDLHGRNCSEPIT